MKKNYIAPSTELLDLASEGLMQPAIGLASGSGAGPATASDKDFID